MVIVGPVCSQPRTSKEAPTSAATSGSSQIHAIRRSRRGSPRGARALAGLAPRSWSVADWPGFESLFGSVIVFSSHCALRNIAGFKGVRRGPPPYRVAGRPAVPATARVIAHGGQHGQYDDHAKADGA